jgi:hypothetical protein
MKLPFVGKVPGAMPAWGRIAGEVAESFHQASELLVVWSPGRGAAWTAQLPPEKRPPVLLVGPLKEGPAAPDEWVGSLDNQAELPLRLRLAVLRGRERRRTARRAMVDPLTHRRPR